MVNPTVNLDRVSVTLGVEAIEEVEHFTYLSRVVGTHGGTEADVKADRKPRGIAISKQTPNKLDTAGDNWRYCLRTGIPGGIMLAAYNPRRGDDGLTD